MAVFTTILIATAVTATMTGSILNAVKADQNKQCNIEGMNKLVDHYKQINEQFQKDINTMESIEKTLENLNNLENAEITDLQNKLTNNLKDYQKHVNTVYIYFAIFMGVIVVICIVKAVFSYKHKSKMKKEYLKIINK